MPELRLSYRTLKHALPPRPIRLELPGWAGDPNQKRVDGAVAQPWHCVPFVEGATYGLELLYPHETECAVTSENGRAAFEWDWKREPGLMGKEFSAFAPGHYGFATWLDLQCPPGYGLRTEPHPRFFADNSGTVPLAIIGNLQTEWWPMFFFAVFKNPPPGQRHIFRKGEPYAQVIAVPHKPSYVLEPMSGSQRKQRDSLHLSLLMFSKYASRSSWKDAHGAVFEDRYRVLAHAFNEGGYDAVMKLLNSSADSRGAKIGDDVPLDRAMQMAVEHHRQSRLDEAEAIYRQILVRDSNHADALHMLGVISHQRGDNDFGATLIRAAMAVKPDVVDFHNNLAVCLRAMGQNDEAERVLKEAVARQPKAVGPWINLGDLAMAQGRGDEAVAAWRKVVSLAPSEAGARFRLGTILQQLGRIDEARAEFQRALDLQPDFAEARHALKGIT